MEMVHRHGSRKRLIAPLLLVLAVFGLHHAAAPSPTQSAYRAARTALDRGETARATELVDAALAAAATRKDDVWPLKILRAELLWRKGDAKTAASLFRPEPPVSLRTSEAAVYRLILLARTDRQPKHLATARSLAEKYHPRLLPHIAVSEIPNADPKSAARIVATALRQARANKDENAEARVLAAHGFWLTGQERYSEAITVFEKALPIARKLGLVPTQVSIEGNLGWAYMGLGDVDTAEQFFASADATARARQLVGERLPWTIQLGNVAFNRDNFSAAAERYSEAVPLARSSGAQRDLGHALENLATIALKQGRMAEARQRHQEARLLKEKINDSIELARSDLVSAELADASGNVDEARVILERLAKTEAHPSIQWEALGELAGLHLKTKNEALAERDFREALETVRETRSSIDRNLRVGFLSHSLTILNSYLDFLIDKGRVLDALAATESYRTQTLQEGLGDTKASKLDAVAVAKNANATVLCYWLGKKRSFMWVVTPTEVTFRPLPAAANIIKAAAAYQRELRGPRGTLTLSGNRGQDLYRTLVEPAGAIGSRVVVVPDGILHTINFETLVVPGPTPRYWIESAIIRNAGSLQLLARRQTKPSASPSMLLVGDPPSPEASFPPLPHAAREVDSVARQFTKPVVLRRQQATPAAYKSAKPGEFDYLHFVAHGVGTRQTPLDSAVILARDKTNEYRLSARDIVNTPLRAQLVTISSCHGAGSRTYAGEGLVGLAWAFLSAGADQVIAALWEVDDKATPDLMKEMYEKIRAGQEPAIALRNAKLGFLRSGTIRSKPSYWAPFVLYTGR